MPEAFPVTKESEDLYRFQFEEKTVSEDNKSSEELLEELFGRKETKKKKEEVLMEEGRKRWKRIWEKAYNSSNRLRDRFFGVDEGVDSFSKDKKGTDPKQRFVDVGKESLQNLVLTKEDIEDVENLLGLVHYFREEYSKNIEDKFDGKNALDLDINDSYYERFCLFPENYYYEDVGSQGEESEFWGSGSPEEFIEDLVGLNMYKSERDGRPNFEKISTLLKELDPESLKTFCDVIKDTSIKNLENARDALAFVQKQTKLGNEVDEYDMTFHDRNGFMYTLEGLTTDGLGDYEDAIVEVSRNVIKESVIRGERIIARDFVQVLGEKGHNNLISEILVSEEFSRQQRLDYTAEIINVYGFIPGINILKAQFFKEDLSEEVAQELEWVFFKLQGEEDETDVIKELSDIYNRINFDEYALNNEKLTKDEVAMVQEQIEIFSELSGIDSKDPFIIDIGAGTGRHSLLLTEKGQRNVIAFDYEKKHVDIINRHADELSLDLVAIQGDWDELNEILERSGLDRFDVGIVLNRTIMHNTTPDSMIHWWDELSKVFEEKEGFANPRIIIDIPNIKEGQYLEKTKRLRESLKSCGVEEAVTMHLFDGPSEDLKFNRLALTEQQFRVYAALFGFNVVDKTERVLGTNKDIYNDYYVLEKLPDYNPEDLTPEIIEEAYEILGVTGLGINWDMQVDSWGVSLKEASSWLGIKNAR